MEVATEDEASSAYIHTIVYVYIRIVRNGEKATPSPPFEYEQEAKILTSGSVSYTHLTLPTTPYV